MEKRSGMMKAMPWLLLLVGLWGLNHLPWMAALTLITIGVVMLIEKIWPEKWGESQQ